MFSLVSPWLKYNYFSFADIRQVLLLVLSHWTKLKRSWLIFLFIYFKEELTYRILVSSRKWCTDKNIIILLRLLIYIRNSKVLILSLEACQTQYFKVQTVFCEMMWVVACLLSNFWIIHRKHLLLYFIVIHLRLNGFCSLEYQTLSVGWWIYH